ncbi:MAG: sugar phosphate isomerase/epimerase [Opitutaceae bacterium]|nr:sugar phosphate isomerase/epimerase [Opitutaceae bacterium]
MTDSPAHAWTRRRATSSLGYPEASLTDLCALAMRHGLDAVELRVLEGRLDLPAYFSVKYGTPTAFAETARIQPVPIALLGTSFQLRRHTQAEVDALLAFVPWAEAAGIPWLRIFDGDGTWDDEARAQAARFLAHWETLREQRGWQSRLLIETHSSLLTAESLHAFAVASPHALYLWDAHHTWKHSREEPQKTFAAISERVRHVHVKDSVPRPYKNFGYTYVLPGQGDFPIQQVLAALNTGFSGLVSLEWERQWHPYLPSLDEALSSAAAARWW